MKTQILILAILLVCMTAVGQNVGIGTTTPDASAKLDVESTTEGFLMPRMTEAQRNGIISPATGLMVYQTNNSDGTYYYDGTQWRNLSDNLGNHTATTTLNMDTNKIVNVPTPVAGLDAVNKDYVDAAVAAGGGGGSIGCNMPTEISLKSTFTGSTGTAWIYCDTLTEGGNNDWVLPNFEQLSYALSGGTPIPGGRTSTSLWTRTRSEFNQGYTAYVNELNGGWGNAPSSTAVIFRCVR